MRARLHLATLLALLVPAALLAVQPAQPTTTLGPVERIAEGIQLYRLDDPGLLNPPGPIAVQALRIDPGTAAIEIGVAGNRLPARETVQGIAARRGALCGGECRVLRPGQRPAGRIPEAPRLCGGPCPPPARRRRLY